MALRINKADSRPSSAPAESEPRQKVIPGQRGFSVDLSKEADQQTRERLEELLKKIQEQGKTAGTNSNFQRVEVL